LQVKDLIGYQKQEKEKEKKKKKRLAHPLLLLQWHFCLVSTQH
jgi:hypothetical protein